MRALRSRRNYHGWRASIQTNARRSVGFRSWPGQMRVAVSNYQRNRDQPPHERGIGLPATERRIGGEEDH